MIKLKNLNKYEAYGSGIPTGWKERAISVDDDEQEAAVEEILAYAKRDDDRIEWDVDYNGGAFADSRVFYIYSDGATFEEVRYTVRQMKDDAIYGRGVYEGCHNKRKKKSKRVKKEDYTVYATKTTNQRKLDRLWKVCEDVDDFIYECFSNWIDEDEIFEYLVKVQFMETRGLKKKIADIHRYWSE